MTCKELQELIVTDFVDGELDAAQEYEIQRHLKTCAACGEFAEAVKSAVQPLRDAQPEEPPAAVWRAIEERLRHEAQRRIPSRLATTAAGRHADRVFGLFQWGFRHSRPVFALSTVMTIVLAASLVFTQAPHRRRMAVGQYLNEQSNFIYSLRGNVFPERGVDFGTGVERLLD